MKTILVTGGAGFIGSNFVKFYNEKYNYRIVNLDLLTYAGDLDNLQGISENEKYRFVKGNITDDKLVESLFIDENFDYVINFAAESHVDRSIEDPSVFLKTNVLGTQVLLDAAKKHWTTGVDEFGYPTYKEGVKFLQISTDEVYGALGKNGLFTETTPLAPNSPYSASKASADMIVRAYNETYNLPSNITRCSNNYGPNQHEEKLIPLMITNCMSDNKMPVYGDGLQVRDWLHVLDHCRAIDLVLSRGESGRVYNVGGNNEIRNIDIIRKIIHCFGKTDDLIDYVQDRLGHDRRYAIDNSRIKSELGWEPIYTFDNGLDKTIDWYKVKCL